MFINDRQFYAPKYKEFIRLLPCCICGVQGVDAHHTKTRGRIGTDNDYSCVPVHSYFHTGKGHITKNRLEELTGEGLEELTLFYLSLYGEYTTGNYNPEFDDNFSVLYEYRFGKNWIGKYSRIKEYAKEIYQ